MLPKFLLYTVYFIAVHVFAYYVVLVHFLESNRFKWTQNVRSTYHYIIVGAGTAGSIVAKRLSQDPSISVLLIEEGLLSENSIFNIPSLGVMLQGTNFDRNYRTVPQKNAAHGLVDNKSVWPLGKGGGGSNLLNNLMYVRAHSHDFKEWFKDKSGFNYTSDVLPFYKNLEYFLPDERKLGQSMLSGLEFTSRLPQYILEGVKSMGFAVTNALMESYEGFGKPVVNILNGVRWTPFHQLRELNRDNIKILGETTVVKVLFKNNFEAYAVMIDFRGKLYKIRASTAIILSAGTIGTPKILLQSGVGPKGDLQSLGIKHILDLPVGQNLQDHVTTGMDLVQVRVDLHYGLSIMLSPLSLFQYFWNGNGPLTTVGCEALGYLSIKNKEKPDLQFMVMPLGVTEDRFLFLGKLMGIKEEAWTNYFQKLNETSVTILPVLLHPKSRGTVKLASKFYKDPPLLDPNYLSHPDDVKILIQGIRFIQKLVKTKAMEKIGAKVSELKYPGCENFDFDSDQYWECYIRQLTITAYHPVGTCSLGTVVNHQFQVIGTNKLYIVDGSVLPTLPSGNTNSPIMVIAEMASEIMENQRYLNSAKSKTKDIFIKPRECQTKKTRRRDYKIIF